MLLFCLILTFKAMAVTDQYDGNTQSYIIHDTGEVSTIKSYFTQDSIWQFLLPDIFLHAKVNLKVAKGNYFVDEWDVITTVNKDGFSFTLDQVTYDAEDIDIYGHSYWINKDGSLHVVKNDGTIADYKKPFKDQDVDLNDVKIAGGTFMITDENKLIIVDPSGRITNKSKFFKYKWEQVKKWGHNWYQTSDGKIFTIGFKQLTQKNADGTEVLAFENGYRKYYAALYAQKQTYEIARKGGNYFFDKYGNLSTISNDGFLNLNLGQQRSKFKMMDSNGKKRPFPAYYGINYFIYSDGAVYQVDNAGFVQDIGVVKRRVARSNMYK